MKNLDKLISALYHANSDNREKMLSDLILTVLYSTNEYMDIQTINELIKDFFYLEPIKFEVKQCLISLVENNQIKQKDTTYCLEETTKSYIHSILVKVNDSFEKRFESFNKIVNEIFIEKIENEDILKLWEIYNEYLLECFMVFGRKAINMFLPYKKDEFSQSDIILEQAKINLQSEKLFSIFKKLIVEYPERLTEAELRHLNGLASRAERFYSLGIEKKEYEMINNLQIKNLTILVDTNILYSVLNLHVHQEKSAITEIIRLAKEKIIDLKIVYLPKTYHELQIAKTHLEKIISRTKFNNNHIKAMLASGNLDSFAKQYYENKLKNSDYPHPADNIKYASDILKEHGIIIYNQKFSQLDREENEYLNEKIVEYYDYQKYYNNSNEKGFEFHLNKDDYKIEHDVYLREAIKILKLKSSKEILDFIGLTIDRSLVRFDHYMLGKENTGSHEVINPNFMVSSVFLKKICCFIPIVTNDYRKAFLSSLSSPSFERESEGEQEKTILTQKSMEYFKNLGIEDEEVICNIIKRELFLEEFSIHEKNNTSEDFIKSEIDKEIAIIKLKQEYLEKEIKAQKIITDKILESGIEESNKLIIEKGKIEKEKQIEIDILNRKINEKESLEKQLQKLNEEQAKFSLENTIKLKKEILIELNQSILVLENTKKPLVDIIKSKYKNYIWRLSTIPIAYFLTMCFLIYTFTWAVMVPFTYLISLFGLICTYLYLAISGESFSPLKYFNNIKLKIINQVYSDFKFDIEFLNKQRQHKTDVEEEIKKLSNEIKPELKDYDKQS